MKTRYKNSQNPRSGENSKLLKTLMKSFELPPIDIADPEQVQERISEYFDFCIEYNLFPCIAGLSNWLGIHRDTLNSWKRGEYRKDTHQKIIQRAYDLIEVLIVDLLQDDKMPSLTGIFLLKSMFGYTDRYDLSYGQGQIPKQELFSEHDLEEAKKRLLAEIPSGGDDE